MRPGPLAAAIGTAVVATYPTLLRRRVLHWGATQTEATAALPGDELLRAADGVSTRAIGIGAPARAIWPWLAQMGPSPRGGAYTYDWIENLLGLDMHSADTVLREFQHPAVGDTIGFGSNRMRVERVEPEKVLAWRSEDGNWVWAFVLREHDGNTRLISRNRFRLPGAVTRIGMLAMEPASLVMERKMLLGIKQRAERLASHGPAPRTAEGNAPSQVPGNGTRVLVTYATRFGSTQGIAERIAAILGETGLHVDVRLCGDVADVDPYSAVVMGSPVFDQRWLPEFDQFAHSHLDVLAARPVWLFSVGTFSDRKRLIGPLMAREPRGIGAFRQRVAPHGYRVFAGVIERERWPFASRLLYHAFGGRLGDNRDWPEVEAWARQISDYLRSTRVTVAQPPFPGSGHGRA